MEQDHASEDGMTGNELADTGLTGNVVADGTGDGTADDQNLRVGPCPTHCLSLINSIHRLVLRRHSHLHVVGLQQLHSFVIVE